VASFIGNVDQEPRGHSGSNAGLEDVMDKHFCEFPLWGSEVCGQPACTKVRCTWLCALHEEPGEMLLEAAAKKRAALDDLAN
jgi:hypothetical protein